MAESRKARQERRVAERRREETLPTYDQLINIMADNRYSNPELFQAAYEAIDEGDYQKVGVGEALGRGAIQGATFGFGEEIQSGIRAAADKFWRERFGMEPKEYGELYEQRLAENRAQLEAARRDRPGAMFAGEMLGGLTTGGTGLARSVAGRTLVPAVMRATGTSTGMGALGGYGYSEGDPLAAYAMDKPEEQQRAELAEAGGDVLLGGGIGAMLGPAAPLVGAGGKAAGRGLVGMTQRGQQAKIDEAARMAVEQRMLQGQAVMPENEMQRMLDINPSMTIGDLDEGMRDMVQSVAQTPTPGARNMRQKLIDRNKGAYERINPTLTKTLGQETENTAEAIENFKTAAREEAKENYRIAYQRAPEITRPMIRLLTETPEGRFALRQARKVRQSRGGDPDYILKPNSPQSMQDMDTILRSLKQQERAAWSDPQKVKQIYAEQIGKNADAFEAELYRQNPAYEIARTTHGTKQSNQEAFDYGRNIFSEDPNRVQLDIKDLSDKDVDLMKLGVLDALTQKVKKRPYAADPTKAVMNSRRDEEIFELVLGGDDQMRAFEDFIKSEQMMFDSLKKGTTGSPTVKLAQAQMSNVAKAMEYSLYTLGLQSGTGAARGLGAVGQAIGRAMRDPRVTEEQAERFYNTQADLLMSRDLQALQQPGRIAGLLSPEVPTLPARAMGGLLATGKLQPGVEYGPEQ